MRVLILAATTGYQTRSFGDAAERLGVELVFATDRCQRLEDPWQDRAIAIRFHDEDASVAAVLAAAKAHPIDGLLAVGDRPTVIAARVAAALGLPWHPPEGAAVARHKLLTRDRLRAAGLPVPWFVPVALSGPPSALGPHPGEAPDARRPQPPASLRSLAADPSSRGGAVRSANGAQAGSSPPRDFPCVVKPVALSGSRGVMRADDPETLAAAFERLRVLLRSPEVRRERNDAHEIALVEAFIPGREYAIEALMHHGGLQVLAIFDKPEPLDGPFFEETVYVTPSSLSADEETRMMEAVRRAAQAIGLHHGPVHAECRVNADGVFVLEAAARPIGGLCGRALRFRRSDQSAIGSLQSAMSLEELLLRHALGEDPARYHREAEASGVMMIPIPRRGIYRGVQGVDAARAVAGVDEVRITAKPDQLLLPLPEGASYLGFIFARAARAAGVEQALGTAHARLAFTIDPEFPFLTAAQIHYNQHHG